MADLNGDGKADLIYGHKDRSIGVMLSTGTSFQTETRWGWRVGDYAEYGGGFRMADVNGDGLADFVYDCSDNHIRIKLSTGSGFQTATDLGIRTVATSLFGGLWPADMDGDGLTDLVYTSPDNAVRVFRNKGPLPYQYDTLGNLIHVTDAKGNETIITYDSLSRKTTMQDPDMGYWTYTYDLNGNMTSNNGKTITYDYDNRATSIVGTSTVDNTYDYTGQRVKKVNATSTIVYIGKLYEITNGTPTKYIFAGSQRIASKTGSTTYYYHSDHLGSTGIVTDQTGAMVQEIYYYPFGQVRANSGNATRYKYTGQEDDAETGLYYYGARYYDPVIGRFISADSIVQESSDPQTLNRYSYCANNPLIYADPTGHIFGIDDLFIGVMIGSIVGSVVMAGVESHWDLGEMWKAFVIASISAGFAETWGPGVAIAGPDPTTNTTWAYNEVAGAQSGQESLWGLGEVSAVAPQDAGGVLNCKNCNPVDKCPNVDLSELGSRDLFDVNEASTSKYGYRIHPTKGTQNFHSGVDYKPLPKGVYGESLVYGIGDGGIVFGGSDGVVGYHPDSWSVNAHIKLRHVSLSPNLEYFNLPLHVNAGEAIAVLQNIGPSSGPHVHLEFWFNGERYNPACICK